MRFSFYLLLSVGLVLGCQPMARKRVDSEMVRSIRFSGNGGPFASGNNDLQLRGVMQQAASPFGSQLFPLSHFVDGASLSRDTLEHDAYRLETWYAHHGWFDARFEGWTIRTLKPERGQRASVVEIVGHVDPGEPTFYDVLGEDGASRKAKALQVNLEALPKRMKPIVSGLIRAAQRRGWVHRGGQFDLDSVYATRDQLLELLHNASMPYAKADVGIDVYPEQHVAEVRLDLDTGPVSRFGETTILGAEGVLDETYIWDILPFREGQPFKTRLLREAQRRLYGLGAFSVARVDPQLDPARESKSIPVVLDLKRAPPRSLRLGGGFEFDGRILTPRLSGAFSHANIAKKLMKFDLYGSFGLALLLSDLTYEELIDVNAEFTWPRIIRPKRGESGCSRTWVDWTASAGVDQELLAGQLPFLQAQGRTELVWKLCDKPNSQVQFRAGPSVYYTSIEDDEVDRVENLIRATFGANSPTRYLLTAIEASITVDRRDPAEVLRPRIGSYWQLGVRQTLPFGREGVFFTELRGDARIYRRIVTGPLVRWLRRRPGRRKIAEALGIDMPKRNSWSTAFRLSGRWLFPWEGSSVPYAERVFLGGGANIRGFRTDSVGVYDCVCLTSPDRRRYVPRGGLLSTSGTAELRWDIPPTETLTVVPLFVDLGMLVDSWREVSRERIRWSVGVGARYDTMVGPFRLDLAFRPTYPEDRGPDWTGQDLSNGRYYGCDVVGPGARAHDLLSGLDFRTLRDVNRAPRPWALQLVLALGEAL